MSAELDKLEALVAEGRRLDRECVEAGRHADYVGARRLALASGAITRDLSARLLDAAPALIAAAREVERLRAFVPRWERVMGAWELRACGIRVGWVEWVGHDYIARIDVGRGGWQADGTHPDLPTAAAAVCARLGIASVGVPDAP